MRPFLAVLVLMMLAGGSARAQEKSWAGKTIVTKKAGIKIDFLDEGTRIPAGTLDEIVYRVLDEKKGLLKVVTARSVSGWFDKTDAVPLDEANAYFSEHLRMNPTDARAYHVRGLVSKLEGKFEFALKDYSESLRLEPQATVFNNRAVALHALKEYDKAIADYTEAIGVDPTLITPYYGRGVAWTQKKEYDRAIEDFDKVITLEPKHVAAHNGRGDAWRGRKEYDKAIDDYTVALKLDPRQAFVVNNRGLARFLKGDYASALQDFDTSERLDAKNAWVFKNRARLLATAASAKYRDGVKAVELATKAIKLEKQPDADFNETLAAAHAEAGNFEEAVRTQAAVVVVLELQQHDGTDARIRLEQYRKKQPYRQASLKQELGEAEQAFRAAEKKLADADTVQIALKFAVTGGKESKIRALVLLAKGNKARIDLIGEVEGESYRWIRVSDGAQTKSRMTKGADKLADWSIQDTPADANAMMMAGATRAGLFGASNALNSPPELGTLSAFSMGTKEKVGDRPAQRIDYQIRLKLGFTEQLLSAQLWLDSETNLPVKRVITSQIAGATIQITETYDVSVNGKIDPKEFALPK